MKFTTSLIRFEVNNLKRVVVKTIAHTKEKKVKGRVVVPSMPIIAAPTEFWTLDKKRLRWFMRVTDPDDTHDNTIRGGMSHGEMQQTIHLAMTHYPEKKVWFSGDTCNITIDNDLMEKYQKEQKKKKSLVPGFMNCGCYLGGNLIIKKKFDKPQTMNPGDELTLTVQFEET